MEDLGTEFVDGRGARWRVEVLWAHPAPGELGIRGARFTRLDTGERARIGFVEEDWIRERDVEELRTALDQADPVPADPS